MAQPKPPTAAEKQQAGELVKQAIAKSQEKDHLAAIDLYLKAYAVVPLPTLLSNVGTEYQQASKPVEALKYFCLYLEKDPAGALVTYATSHARVLQVELGNNVSSDAEVCKPIAPPPVDSPGAGSGVNPGPDQPLPILPPPESPDPGGSMKLGGMIGAGVGLVTVGLGFYFGVQAKKINDDVEDQGPTEMWRNDIRAYMVGRGKTVEARQQTMTVLPTVAPDGGGVSFSGRF